MAAVTTSSCGIRHCTAISLEYSVPRLLARENYSLRWFMNVSFIPRSFSKTVHFQKEKFCRVLAYGCISFSKVLERHPSVGLVTCAPPPRPRKRTRAQLHTTATGPTAAAATEAATTITGAAGADIGAGGGAGADATSSAVDERTVAAWATAASSWALAYQLNYDVNHLALYTQLSPDPCQPSAASYDAIEINRTFLSVQQQQQRQLFTYTALLVPGPALVRRAAWHSQPGPSPPLQVPHELMQVAKDVAMNAVDDNEYNEGDAVKKTSNSNNSSNSSGTQAAALAAKLWTTG